MTLLQHPRPPGEHFTSHRYGMGPRGVASKVLKERRSAQGLACLPHPSQEDHGRARPTGCPRADPELGPGLRLREGSGEGPGIILTS